MGTARARLTALQARRHECLGRLAQCRAEYTSERRRVGEAKARVEAGTGVRGVIEELQRRQHARTVGAFERLLSAFLVDVFEEPREVVLDVYSRQGAPAMDVGIRKGEFTEDAMHGTGGGVTNVLSTGLRLIALTRSGRRPFIILDEPDCWLETGRVAAFAGVLQQVAARLGVQVLLVSHHSEEVLRAIPYHVRIEAGERGIEARGNQSGIEHAWDANQPGLRRIALTDCYGHAHTTLRLAPGVTVLRGGNDAGKSSLVAALRAALGDAGNDSMIRHGANEAQVVVEFEHGRMLRFTRKRRGTPKVRYELLETREGAETVLREGTDAKNAPDWVLETSGIGEVEGLDVQIGNQKSPVFLLNETATLRARALAVGDDESFVQAMATADRTEVREAQAAARRGEGELERLHRFVTVLGGVEARQPAWAGLVAEAERLDTRQQQAQEASGILQQWRMCAGRAAALRRGIAELAPAPAMTGLRGRSVLDDLVQASRRAAVLRKRAEVAAGGSVAAPAAPAAASVAQAWRRVCRVRQALARLGPAPTAPGLHARGAGGLVGDFRIQAARVAALHKRLAVVTGAIPPAPTGAASDYVKEATASQARAAAARLALVDAQVEEADATKAMRGVDCPTCGRPLLEEPA